LNVFRLIGLGVLLTLSISPAFALKPAQHTVTWYRTHQHERETILETCQNNHFTDNEAECRNALSGAHAALADSLLTTGTKDPEADPAYYEHDTGMIAMILSMCTRQAVPLSWCQAAQTAASNRPR
jgi:hypothetical protein